MKKYTEEELKALDPVTYAKQVNAALREAGDTAFLLVEDPDHYRYCETAYDYEKGVAAQVLSDVYKEQTGIRPRGVYPIEKMTLADIEEEIARLVRQEE